MLMPEFHVRADRTLTWLTVQLHDDSAASTAEPAQFEDAGT